MISDILSANEDNIIIENRSLVEGNFFEDIDRWKTSNQDHSIQKFKSDSLTDAEYDKVKSLLSTMKETEDFNEYSKAFAKFCYFCHIVPRGVILKRYDLEKGKTPDHNSIYVEYSYNTKKINLPEGTVLYHMSKVDGIKELIPVFRGKSVKGYMYDKPRVYFTIRKNMPKFLADYKINEKLHMYICKKPIKQAYVDPLVWNSFQGAVYVETNTPIPVEQIEETSTIKKIIDKVKPKNKEEENIEESSEFDFEHFYQFVSENGLIICNNNETFRDIEFI